MAGIGSRFSRAGYSVPKPLIDVDGKPMIQLAVESLSIPGQFLFVTRDDPVFGDQLVDVLRQATKDPIIKSIDYLTDGAACTCLLLSEYIDNDNPLIITNCDQVMEWDGAAFLRFVEGGDFDGAVVTYAKQTEKNSYVRLGPDGFATEFAEKKIISEHSLNGIHYWRRGADFVRSANAMIKNSTASGEFYVSLTYNELVREGKRIVVYEIPLSQHFAVGTPEDLATYLAHKREIHGNP
jgi:NDP-sugar pyrophosphorylase family protein